MPTEELSLTLEQLQALLDRLEVKYNYNTGLEKLSVKLEEYAVEKGVTVESLVAAQLKLEENDKKGDDQSPKDDDQNDSPKDGEEDGEEKETEEVEGEAIDMDKEHTATVQSNLKLDGVLYVKGNTVHLTGEQYKQLLKDKVVK